MRKKVKEKDRPKTASCGSSRNSSSPCFSDQSGDTEKIYSSSDYDDDLDDDVVKGEENSHSTPGAKQQSCLLQDLQSNNDSDIQLVRMSTLKNMETQESKQVYNFF